jgi:hypothetical protein
VGGVDQQRRGLHPAQLLDSDDAFAAFAESAVDGDVVGRREQLVFVQRLDAMIGGMGGVQIVAPGHHTHAEGHAHHGDTQAQGSQSDDAERPSRTR